MNRALLAAGVVLLAVGILIFGLMARSRIAPDARVPLAGAEQGLEPDVRLWSFAGGLALAAGMGCLGIGMNQWRQGRRSVSRRRT